MMRAVFCCYDSDLEYLKGDESFMFDVYYYDIEKRY